MKLKHIFLLLTLLPFSVHAKQGFTIWSDLVSRSDLIAQVSIEEVMKNSEGSGTSKVKIKKILKGDNKTDFVFIDWKISTIQSALFNIYQDHVVFLQKNENGKYSAAALGKSFWELEKNYTNRKLYTDSSMFSFYYIEEIPEQIYEEIEVPATCNRNSRLIKRIYLNKLIEYFTTNKT